LLFRKPALLHDFLSPLEAILSSFNWSENHRAGQTLGLHSPRRFPHVVSHSPARGEPSSAAHVDKCI
ncbi:hypothetical protein, partial [Burkholderia gladioli]|uniref:hypothetical protein n=1 Tax=Burkholderia gladioli TaxID=28095 RepID=UPI001ABAF5E8